MNEKQAYIARITEELNECNDISLLDLIFQLLYKQNEKENR